MSVIVFPGQGSQALGMGSELFPHYPELVSIANDILGYDIVELCLRDPNRCLSNTLYTQPAIFVVSAIAYLDYLKKQQPLPNYVLGHSLGEYNALFAAGSFDFATGLRLVKQRAELMSTIQGGGMAAILGLPHEKITEILRGQQLSSLSIANYNSYTQSVISGKKSEIELAKPIFEQLGVRFIILNVSGAFHSTMMDEAAAQFHEYLLKFHFANPSLIVISNYTAKPYPVNKISHLLFKQLAHSVKWVESIEYLRALGETEFIEIGHGTILTMLIKRIIEKQ